MVRPLPPEQPMPAVITLFSSLALGNYQGAVLPAGYVSSSVNAADPDNNIDKDDNGVTLAGKWDQGLAITLSSLNEKRRSSTKIKYQ